MTTDKKHILDTAREQGLASPGAGLDVPPGYFESFAKNFEASLPHRAELEHPDDVEARTAPRTLWNAMRPYVYMAAMFAGIWLMLQLFNIISGNVGSLQPMDYNPVLAEALGNDDFMNQYFFDNIEPWDIVDSMHDSDASLADDFDPDYLFTEPDTTLSNE